MIRRLLAVLALVCCGLVATGAAASACPKSDNSPAALSKKADAVFTGTVADRAKQGQDVQYTVDVKQIYKGGVGEQASLSTARAARACGEPDLQKGQDYVFFVAGSGDNLRIEQDGAAPATNDRVAKVERLLGQGTSPTPPAPVQADLTLVGGETTSLARLAAPGVALVIVGLLGLLLVVSLGRRRG